MAEEKKKADCPGPDSDLSDDNGGDGGEGEGVSNPGMHDVLLGRGGGTNNHEGNIKFRKLVNEHKIRYLACSKIEKPKVAREVVAIWRKLDPPGRFLTRKDTGKKGPGSVKDASNIWYEVGDKKAREKASQCLRERTPDVLPFLKQIRDQQDQLTERGLSMIHQQQQQLQMQQAEGAARGAGGPGAILPNQNGMPQRPPQEIFGMSPSSQQMAAAAAQGFPGVVPSHMMNNGEGNNTEVMNFVKMQQVAGNAGADFPLFIQQQRHLENMRREAAAASSSFYDNPAHAAAAAAAAAANAGSGAAGAAGGPVAPAPVFSNNELQQKEKQQQFQMQQLQLKQQQTGENQQQEQQKGQQPQPQLDTSASNVAAAAAAVRNGDDGGDYNELSSDDYRKTLEAYISNNQIPESEAREFSTTTIDYTSDFTESEVYEEDLLFDEDDNNNSSSNFKKRRGRVKRTASSKSTSLMSVVSHRTTKSSMSHLSGLSGLESMTDMMSTDMLSTMSTREGKMNAARSLGSNLSLMSELTDMSHSLDNLTLHDD